VWDEHLERRFLAPTFALNTINYDATADILLPRAVGYAAGFLDYFFRGDFDAELDADTLIITNRTVGEDMDGTFELYYDDEQDVRTFVASWPVVLAPDGSSGRLTVPAISEANPPKDPESFYLVFRGRIGGEDGAVAGRQVTREPIPGIWLIASYTDYVNGAHVGYPTQSYELPQLAGYGGFVDEVVYTTFPNGYSQLSKSLLTLYRSLKNAPGETASLVLEGGCADAIDNVTVVDPHRLRVDIVEFRLPRDRAALEALDYEQNPPKIKRILHSEELPPFEFVSLPALDVRGVRFLGIKASRTPGGYPPYPTPPFFNSSVCFASGGFVDVR
jgi:hypothetical protein